MQHGQRQSGDASRILFLDRDGVINEKARKGEYITTWDAFRFRDGIVDLLTAARDMGYRNIVITNQQCVGKGIIRRAELEELHRRMVAELAVRGVTIDAVYYCPHLESEQCACRKPKPGLLERAVSEWNGNIELNESYFVGDSESDVQAGSSFGVPTIWLKDAEERHSAVAASYVAHTFQDIKNIIRS